MSERDPEKAEEAALAMLFDELRERDGESAPGFATTWAQAAIRAEAAGARNTRWAWGGAGAFAVAAALWFVLAPREEPEVETDVAALEIVMVESEPLAFLTAQRGSVGSGAEVSFDVRPFRYRLDEVIERGSKGGAL